jgi:cytochrome d ubiquinol oxidase subunit I
MDVLFLSRLQFALTACFHFIFVPLTLGLVVLVAVMETRYVRTGDELYLRQTRFWGKLFLINFIVGVVTGITLEFQFGMNWAEYSKYVGDLFGAPLAIEATVAFFLESSFLGLWIFGWNKISKRLHAASIWIVAIASNLSALWILLANAWMQHPVGYELRNGRAEMVDFMALITNPYGWLKFFHTVLAGYVLAAFFVMGVSAYHLLKKNHRRFFKTSFRTAAAFGLASSLLLFWVGDHHAAEVSKTQPTKFAAMESLWETQRPVAYHLLLIPDPKNERNLVETLSIPKLMSYLAFRDFDAEITGLKDFPKEDRPPVMITFLSFRGMLGIGVICILLSFMAFLFARKDRLESHPVFLKVMFYALFLPYIGVQLGWIVAEVGRQPWLVYGLLRTSEGVSKSITTSQVLFSLTGFVLIYGLLAILDIYLLVRFAKQGPEPDRTGKVGPSATQEA